MDMVFRSPSSSSSSSISGFSYHVFLSFRGADTRKTFTDYLYRALIEKRIRTFRDDDAMEIGRLLKPELEKAIQQSQVSVIIFSKSFATSKWCLDEVMMIMEEYDRRSSTNYREVVPVFYHIDPADVRNQTGCFEDAFKGYDDEVTREADVQKKNELSEKVEAWRVCLRRAGSLSEMVFKDGYEGKFLTRVLKVIRNKVNYKACMKVETQVKNLGKKMDRARSLGSLSDATTRAGGFSGSCGVPGLPDLIIGLDQHLANLKSKLLMKETRVLVVSAPPGFGKTTLAKMLCHDHEIKGIFGENIIYVTVSAFSNLEIIAQKLFAHFEKIHSPFQSEEDAKNQLENLLRQMGSDKMLLVLDDVWDGSESIVQDLVFQSTGLFKILVTSRFSFPSFSKYELTLLNEGDAKTLLSCSAFPKDRIPVSVPDDLVNKMVKSCKGLPLALTVVGASLCGQPRFKWTSTLKKWSDGQSILQSHKRLLGCLQTSIDALDELPNVKECFLDLGLFPEDDKIAGTALLDIWVELYGLDNEGMYASENLHDLSLRNLVNLVPISKDATDIEGYCCEHYVTQHDLLRELAIHLNDQKPIAERKRLFMEIHRDDLPKWWIERTEQPINARVISISTDEAFSSNWFDLDAPYVGVLILNVRSKNYALPQFIKRMSQLKVLIVTGYGVYPTQIDNLHFLGSLTNLRRIRFEHVSVSPSIQVIFAMQNLKKLTFVTCEIRDALKSGTTEHPCMLPNLIDLEIDRCYDLKELPAELCSFVHLEKLCITNCHELDDLPKGLGSLSKLEILRLHCCTKLQQLPESIGDLQDLTLLDISACSNINGIPKQIGNLSGLRVLNIRGCQGLEELPVSVRNLSQLEEMICDDETLCLWKKIRSDGSNVKTKLVEEDRLGSFKKICR